MSARHHFERPHHMRKFRVCRLIPFIIVMIILWSIGFLPAMLNVLSIVIPVLGVTALAAFFITQIVNSNDLAPHKAKRKNGGMTDDYFEPESTADPNIIRTTDGKRYIRTVTGEYKEIAE